MAVAGPLGETWAARFFGVLMFIEYPKALYRDGKWDGQAEPDCVTVNSADEEKAAAPDYLPLGAVVAEPAEAPEVTEEDAIRAKLEAAGVEVDKRWGLKRLKAELDKVA